MIESFIEGRVRLRSPILADPAIAELLSSRMTDIDGVRKVKVSARTNGMLLEYDKTRLPLTLLMRAQDIFLRMSEAENLPRPERYAMIENLVGELAEVLKR
ncbi:MAG: hypothetical protein LBT23_06550 [Synergistaceae bacterium]|jgi:hypothetical protein|nr:hypothetical protein [Synergistaceae bacterium]